MPESPFDTIPYQCGECGHFDVRNGFCRSCGDIETRFPTVWFTIGFAMLTGLVGAVVWRMG